jgi:hypothetical protein
VRRLNRSLAQHGEFLAAGRNYTPDNHGLFVDLGLIRLTRLAPYYPRAPAWSRLARERFERTLRGRLAGGVWLEHSSAYQLLAIRGVEDMLSAYGPDPELESVLAKMRLAAGWMVRPDGKLAQFGDSDAGPVVDWAKDEAADPEQRGLRAFLPAGFAFVRASEPNGHLGYLAVTDGFHNLTHKHADELSFELYDDGRPLVTDTGLYSKDPGPKRDFVLSARAHSVLTVDGLDFDITDPGAAYGSGLEAVGQGDGWYAIQGHNRLLREQGVRHTRLFLYRPGVALIVVDRVRAASPHAYARYFQLAPGVRITGRSPSAVNLGGSGLRASLRDAPLRAPAYRSDVRGQRAPLQGFSSPSFEVFRPRWTVAYADQASDMIRAATFSLDPRAPIRVRSVRWTGDGARVSLAGGSLEVDRKGRRLSVRATGDI